MAQKKPTLSAEQTKAVGKQCTICTNYMNQEDVERGDYVTVKTKRGSVVHSHKHCFMQEVKVNG